MFFWVKTVKIKIKENIESNRKRNSNRKGMNNNKENKNKEKKKESATKVKSYEIKDRKYRPLEGQRIGKIEYLDNNRKVYYLIMPFVKIGKDKNNNEKKFHLQSGNTYSYAESLDDNKEKFKLKSKIRYTKKGYNIEYNSCSDDVVIDKNILDEVHNLFSINKRSKRKIDEAFKKIEKMLIDVVDKIESKELRMKYINEIVNLLQMAEDIRYNVLEKDENRNTIKELPIAFVFNGTLVIRGFIEKRQIRKDVNEYIAENIKNKLILELNKKGIKVYESQINKEIEKFFDYNGFFDNFNQEDYIYSPTQLEIEKIKDVGFQRITSIKDLIDFIEKYNLHDKLEEILTSAGKGFFMGDVVDILQEDIPQEYKNLIIKGILFGSCFI